MLKTNSKQARANIKAYIMNSWNIEEETTKRNWQETKEDIIKEFERVEWSTPWQRNRNRQEAFYNWLRCLPACLGDFVLCRGVQDLGDILEETEEERNRFEEMQAQDKLAYLIYKEVYYSK